MILKLQPRITQQTAADLVATLKNHQHSPMKVDASAVRHIGAVGFEALLAAARSWQTASTSFAVITPSSAFMKGLDHIGLAAGEFGISEE